MGRMGAFRPQCDAKGNYEYIQQHEGYYWCVDSNGKEIQGTKQRFKKPTCPNSGLSCKSKSPSAICIFFSQISLGKCFC